MIRVGYGCPFVPTELISACGFEPRRIIPWPGWRTGLPPAIAGVCPYARAITAEVTADSSLAAVILTTRCDQARRAVDLITQATSRPIFLLNLPKTWQSPGARILYREELARMIDFLAGIGGRKPAASQIIEAARAFAATGRPAVSGSGSVPLALIGGPLLPEHAGTLHMIETEGGHIALDATEWGERTRPAAIDEARLAAAPLDELARVYFDSIPDVFQRPDTRLHDWLAGRLAERDIRGIIVHRLTWCDLWRAEVQRLRDRFALPLLDLEQADATEAVESRLATRIQAFMESIR